MRPHSRALPSSLAVKMVRPSGAKTAEVTPCVWPLNRRRSSPVATSTSRAVRSQLAVRIVCPSGENTAELSLPPNSLNFSSSWPVDASHRRAVLSQLAVRTNRLSEEKTADFTKLVCPPKPPQHLARSHFPEACRGIVARGKDRVPIWKEHSRC